MGKDLFHDALKHALEKDGWTITQEHFPLRDKEKDMRYDIDIFAEKLIVAERGSDKIAVEVKSLIQPSLTYEFHGVLGKFLVYLYGLSHHDPSRKLYLAIPIFAWNKISSMKGLMEIIEIYRVKVIVFKPNTETIVSWIE